MIYIIIILILNIQFIANFNYYPHIIQDHSEINYSMNVSYPGYRLGQSMVISPNDTIFLFGGTNSDKLNGNFYNDIWEYNSTKNEWKCRSVYDKSPNSLGLYLKDGSGYPSSRYAHSMVMLSNLSIIIYGGFVEINQTLGVFADLWRYDPSTNNFFLIGGDYIKNQSYGQFIFPPTPANYSLNNLSPGSRYTHSMIVLKNDSILMFGGDGFTNISSGFLNDLWRYDPQTNQWLWINGNTTVMMKSIINSDGTGYPSGRYGQSMIILANQTVLMYGGVEYLNTNINGTVIGTYLNDMWKYDVVTNRWFVIRNNTNMLGDYRKDGLGIPAARVFHSMVVLPNDTVILFGGLIYVNNTRGILNDLWRYESISNQWYWSNGDSVIYYNISNQTTTNYPQFRAVHSMILLSNLSITIFGGIAANNSQFWLLDSYCYSGFYGPYCNDPCLCDRGICIDGTSGNGSCSSCNSGFYESNCDKTCLCVNGKCNDGTLGDGMCSSCNTSYYGSFCNSSCLCVNGKCNDGTAGDGTCSSCNTSYYGSFCNSSCLCVNGSCYEGINGNGSCYTCNSNYYGLYCNKSCNCSNNEYCDDGIGGSGLCQCYKYCNESNVIDVIDSINFNISDQNIKYEKLLVNSSNLQINKVNMVVSNSLVVKNSTINLINSELIVNKSITIESSQIYMDIGSSIEIKDGCFYNKNITIHINIQQAKLLHKYRILSNINCSNSSFDTIIILISNESKCENHTIIVDDQSISIMLFNKENCPKLSTSDMVVIIVVCSMTIVIMIIFVILLSIKRVRNKLCACRDRKKLTAEEINKTFSARNKSLKEKSMEDINMRMNNLNELVRNVQSDIKPIDIKNF